MTAHRGPGSPAFNVDAIAARLEGLEETIISKLIDRAQFRRNRRVYETGKSGFPGEKKRSLFELRLLWQERMDASFGRFHVPEERPLYGRLPEPQRHIELGRTGLCIKDFNVINRMPAIIRAYLELLPNICRPGDDGHYGSSCEHDVYAVQAIGRRVHYGSLYVAESKFRSSQSVFLPLMKKGDADAIIEKLTRKEIEERIVRRIRRKVVAMQANANPDVRHLIDPDVVASLYRAVIVPLTKQGEALYLLNRKV